MPKTQLTDGSYLLPSLEAGTVPPTTADFDDILDRLNSQGQDAPTMESLRAFLATESVSARGKELDDDEVIAELGALIKGGQVVWNFEGESVGPSGGGGKGEKPKEPDKPVPKKDKEEVFLFPELEVELKVVLLDRGLEKHQAGSDPKYPATPTKIKCSMRQSPVDPKFTKGAVLKVSGAGAVEAYEDDKLTKKWDLAKPIPNDKLTGSSPFELYLKGKTKGKFELKLEADSPSAPFKQDKPGTAKMGVVELQMKLHDEDYAEIKKLQVDPDVDPMTTYYNNLKAKAIPPQKEMSDADKIKKGRILHVQKGTNHGRAKLILKKLGDEWPEGTDDYELVLTPSDTADAEKTSTDLDPLTEQAAGSSKAAVKVSEAKAGDVTLWVEGKAVSKKELDLRLDLGVSGDGQKKRNGDWARFTVVEIQKIQVVIVKGTEKRRVWSQVENRFYVNTEADPDARKLEKFVTITAQIAPKAAKIPIHFMMAGNKENVDAAKWTKDFKYGKLDPKLKAVDKKDRKDVIHLSAETNAEGRAEIKGLVLSRLAGEKYKFGAYIAQDPHLAKYVDGHPDLGVRKPFLGDEWQVWRRIWVQLSYNKNLALPSRAKVITEYENLFVKYMEIDEKKFDKTTIAGLVEHPKWMFDPGEGDDKIICVGDHNKTKFHGLYVAPAVETKPKSHLIICDVQWDPARSAWLTWASTANPAPGVCLNDAGDPLAVVTPALKGSVLVSGKWIWSDGTDQHTGDLAEADITIDKARNHYARFNVKIPAKCVKGACAGCKGGTKIKVDATHPVSIGVRLNGCDGPYNGESGAPHCLIRIWPGYFSTINHEIGHQYVQVRKTKNWLGVPDHPTQYIRHGGVGSHCSKDATPHATAKDVDNNPLWVDGTCWMYHQGSNTRTAWCENCRTDMRIRNLTDFGLDT